MGPEWTKVHYARELNVCYIPTDADMTAEDVERRYVDLVPGVKASVRIPVAIKAGHSLKAMMAGARVAMLTSALLQRGIEHLTAVREGLLAWMEAHEHESIRQW